MFTERRTLMNNTLRRRPHRLHAEHGFTLIEMLVVVAIIAIWLPLQYLLYLEYKREAGIKRFCRTIYHSDSSGCNDGGERLNTVANTTGKKNMGNSQ